MSRNLGLIKLARLSSYGVMDSVDSKELTGIDMGRVGKVIEEYNKINNVMPYPLSEIDCELKYEVEGIYLKNKLADVMIELDRGLCVKIGEGKAIKFVRSRWQIIDKDVKDTTSKNMNRYKDSLGFKEFRWVLNRLLNNKGIEDYYEIFEKEIYEEENGDNSKVESRLRETFNKCISSMRIPDNCIYVKELGNIYNMDITLQDTVKVKRCEKMLLFGEEQYIESEEDRNTFDYGFRLVQNGAVTMKEEGELLERFLSLRALYKYLSTQYNKEMSLVRFHAVLADGLLIAEVNNNILMINAYSPKGLKKVGEGRIKWMDNECVYIESMDRKEIKAYNIDEDDVTTVYIGEREN